MSKPTVVPPAWATAESNNDEPTAPQKATGWTPNQDGVSDWDNWWKCTAWKFLVWLAGLFDMGDTFTPQAGGNVFLSGTVRNLWAQTTGYIVGDKITNSGQQYECFTAGTSAGAGTGPSGTSSNITDGTVHWKWIGVGTGEGHYYHSSEEVITYGVDCMRLYQSNANSTYGGYLTTSDLGIPATGTVKLPLTIPAGRRIKQIITTYYGDGAADLTINFVRGLGNGTESTLDTVTVTNPSAGWATGLGTITPAGANGIILPGRVYTLVMVPNAINLHVGPVTVIYDYPLPT